MPLSGNTVFEVQIGGNDTNGGGFVTGASGTDFSLIATARPNGGTDGSSILAAANGTTTIVCVDAQFTAAIVGNIVYFAGGTGSIAAIRRQVVSRTDATIIVIDAAIAASTGMTMNIGGAILSPAVAVDMMNTSGVNDIITYVKYSATPYAVTSATASVAGGRISLTQGTRGKLIGYNTTRTITNTDALRPTIQAQVSTLTVISIGYLRECLNIIVDGNTAGGWTAVRGFDQVGGAAGITVNCDAINCSNSGFAYLSCINCSTSGCVTTGSGFLSTDSINCVAINNAVIGFYATFTYRCIAVNNTVGFSIYGNSTPVCVNCIAYGNSSDGFLGNPSYGNLIVGCHAENNTGVGFNTIVNAILNSCSAFNNTGGNYATQNPTNTHILTISGSAFVSAVGGNFQLNNTPGAGASLRAAAIGDNTWTKLPLTLGYADIGAAQHQDSPSTTTNIFVIDD